MNDGPKDPFNDLTVAAVSLHELVVAFTRAGFTRREAITLVGHIAGQMAVAQVKPDE